MTESEFRQLRLIKQNLRKKLVRDGIEKRYQVIIDDIQNMLDTYLYEDYKATLANTEMYNAIKNSKHAAFIEHMIKFIEEYENRK